MSFSSCRKLWITALVAHILLGIICKDSYGYSTFTSTDENYTESNDTDTFWDISGNTTDSEELLDDYTVDYSLYHIIDQQPKVGDTSVKLHGHLLLLILLQVYVFTFKVLFHP